MCKGKLNCEYEEIKTPEMQRQDFDSITLTGYNYITLTDSGTIRRILGLT
jgi:hypothetical protein